MEIRAGKRVDREGWRCLDGTDSTWVHLAEQAAELTLRTLPLPGSSVPLAAYTVLKTFGAR